MFEKQLMKYFHSRKKELKKKNLCFRGKYKYIYKYTAN